MTGLSDEDRAALIRATVDPDASCAHNFAPLFAEVERIRDEAVAAALRDAGTHLLAKAVAEADIAAGRMTERGAAIWDCAAWLREEAARDALTAAVGGVGGRGASEGANYTSVSNANGAVSDAQDASGPEGHSGSRGRQNGSNRIEGP